MVVIHPAGRALSYGTCALYITKDEAKRDKRGSARRVVVIVQLMKMQTLETK